MNAYVTEFTHESTVWVNWVKVPFWGSEICKEEEERPDVHPLEQIIFSLGAKCPMLICPLASHSYLLWWVQGLLTLRAPRKVQHLLYGLGGMWQPRVSLLLVCGGQSIGACWSLERCILLAVEHMCSYIPELTQAEKDCISASKMSYFSFEVKWARGSQFHVCHVQFIKQSTCVSTTHKLTLPLLRCWEHFEWVNKK